MVGSQQVLGTKSDLWKVGLLIAATSPTLCGWQPMHQSFARMKCRILELPWLWNLLEVSRATERWNTKLNARTQALATCRIYGFLDTHISNTHTHTHTHITHTHTYTNTNTHIYIYTHIHCYIHTHNILLDCKPEAQYPSKHQCHCF